MDRLHKFSLLVTVLIFPVALHGQEKLKYLDTTVSIEERVSDLLPRLTLEEKVSQITDAWGSKGVPRLKIPPMLKTEGLHSQSYSTGATIFPHAIAMASTFDLNLLSQIGKQTAIESKAAHIRGSWSPVLDVVRDVRWGRVEETYGESPFLVGRMGVAWIKSFQAEGMYAVPKHFAGHGQPVGGRDSHDYGLSERVMRSVHLPPFREAIEEAGAGGVMAAYGVWTDGRPANASNVLLHEILRQEWGFDGIVVSDCGGPEHFLKKHSIVETPAQAAAAAVIAGVSMECGSLYRSGALAAALEEGLINETQVDELVRQNLRLKMRLGLFENPGPTKMVWDKLPEYDTPAARALALKVAEEASVLLKNKDNLLPLKTDIKTIAVIGPNADEGQTGDYSPKIAPGQIISVLQGIKNQVGPETKVIHAKGLENQLSTDTAMFAEAVNAAKQADVVVLVVGDRSWNGSGKTTTGENVDGATLDFPGAQRELIKTIQQTGKPVVLVIVNGKPFTLAWEDENIPAILVTWYPGEEGGNATANILFGKVNPSGRLPLTWPRHVGQVPLFHDYATSGRRYDYYDMAATPQYRFGYGLSYTTFAYSNIKCVPKEGDSGFVTVTADITNTGTRDGDEIAQLYITDVVASVATPVVELRGFQRVALKRGEKKTVTFELKPYDLSLLDPQMVRRVEPGLFRVHVGGVVPESPQATDEHKQKIKHISPVQGVTGEFTVVKSYNAQFAYSLEAPAKVGAGQPFDVALKVKNTGNLTDVTKARLFAGFELGTRSFELAPGEEKSYVFKTQAFKSTDLAVIAGTEMLAHPLAVEKSPARLELRNVQIKVDDNGLMQVSAEGQNMGGDPYQGDLELIVNGKPTGDKQTISLKPGEKRSLPFSHTLKAGGLYEVALGKLAKKQVVVSGGVALALRNPLIYTKLDEEGGATVKNVITGKDLPLIGSPRRVEGRSGKALELTGAGMGIDAQNADIYRKAFTLSAWVKIVEFADKGDLALFGGKAPMGADQDTSGTILQTGLKNKKLFQGFFGRDIAGDKEVPAGTWVNLTYTYDPVALKGTLYLNGEKESEKAQKPYTGPLERIGDSPVIKHGNYLLDEAAVIQDCLSPAMVKMMAQKGLDTLLAGEYISDWRATDAAMPSSLEALTEIPAGTTIKLVVETATADGKTISSKEVELKTGAEKYELAGLQKGDKFRVKARLSSSVWTAVPVLRSVTLGSQAWTSTNDWKKGSAPANILTNFSQP